MKIVACDRCGSFIRQDAMSIEDCTSADMVIFAKKDCFPEKHTGCHIDLCKDCKKSFIEWLGKDIPDNSIPAPVYRPRQKTVLKKEKSK